VVKLKVDFQLLNYYIQFCEKNQGLFEKNQITLENAGEIFLG